MTSSTRSEFSHRTRAYNLARLRAEMFEVLVIGGGIMGAGIAREAALRGYKVALVEMNDYASGATSQSSPLVNFDIADLETSRFDRLYEVGQEQRRFLPLAPNLVSPLPLLLPYYRSGRRDPSLINLGLWMYDGLPISRGESRHQILTTTQLSTFAPHLDASDIVGGVRYFVSRANGTRLTLETIRSAHQHKAVVANHFQVEEFTRGAGKRVIGIRGRDLLTGDSLHVRARVVVSAAGPCTARILALDSPQHQARTPPVKSIHVLVPRKKYMTSEGIAFHAKGDGHWMFFLPFGEYMLLGPWERAYAGTPEQVRAESEDVDSILRVAAEAFPDSRIERDDILSTFAELRPAGAERVASKLDGIAHEREIWVNPDGLVISAGGDLTNHRARAQHLVSHVEKLLARDFGVHAAHASHSAQLPLIEQEGNVAAQPGPLTQVLQSLAGNTREHLDRAYGARVSRVLDYALADSKLCAPIVDGLPYIWAEVPHAVEQEMALTVDDVMMRRLDLFHELRNGAVEAAREVGRYMARMLDWIDSDIEEEVTKYAEAVRLNREPLKR